MASKIAKIIEVIVVTNSTLHIDAPSPSHPHLISDLVHGRLVPGPIWRKRDYRLKFLLRTLMYWPSTVKMLTCRSAPVLIACSARKRRCRVNRIVNI